MLKHLGIQLETNVLFFRSKFITINDSKYADTFQKIEISPISLSSALAFIPKKKSGRNDIAKKKIDKGGDAH